MKTIKVNTYGSIISDKIISTEIYDIIKEFLENKEPLIEVNFEGVIAMATFCAKQIFGSLYIELGQDSFFEKIKISNANQDLKIIINMGIQSAIEESKI
ncbi:DUF4325 domain-containing protein [Empedobacter sp. GD03865]|uniref:STAS-like domain-containing protein n=1 Tax=Empedobacter sp. GD03865 TaxID=2975392 RepID=UPI00244874B5|nr:DUF4325 domain-containing protein [Empedobacter sp. GD03865]MDH0660725.1 STAS-like domain-containing protein [Empedobacter sp. GD03865]